MKRPKQKSPDQLEAEKLIFNQRYKVGDKVRVKGDTGAEFTDTIKHEATIMGGHTCMAWLENKGSYLAERVIGFAE